MLQVRSASAEPSSALSHADQLANDRCDRRRSCAGDGDGAYRESASYGEGVLETGLTHSAFFSL
jgi:hypothetical protein